MASTEWYMSMAAAMAKRSHAQTMVTKWQEKADAAEADIQQLIQEQAQAEGIPPEQVQV